MSKSNSRDANKFHKLSLGLMHYPGNYQSILLELKPTGRRRRVEIGFYDAEHNIWFLKDGYTQVRPVGWFHLPEQQ